MKKTKCVTDGCNELQEYSIVFHDGGRARYCEDCTNYIEWQSKYFKHVKSVKKLEVKKEAGTLQSLRKDKAIMKKTNKCADGCNGQPEYRIVFDDRSWGKYCKDCMYRLVYRNDVKSVKKLEAKKGQ